MVKGITDITQSEHEGYIQIHVWSTEFDRQEHDKVIAVICKQTAKSYIIDEYFMDNAIVQRFFDATMTEVENKLTSLTSVTNPTTGKTMTRLNAPDIDDVASVAANIATQFLVEVREAFPNDPYFEAVRNVAKCAEEFVIMHDHVNDWEEFIEQKREEIGADDFFARFCDDYQLWWAVQWFKKHHDLELTFHQQ